MAPGSIASPKQCQEREALLWLRVNLLEAEDGEKNLLPWEAHPADSYWLMLEDMMEERTQPRRTPLLCYVCAPPLYTPQEWGLVDKKE